MIIVEVHYNTIGHEHTELFGPFDSNHAAQVWAKDLLEIANKIGRRYAVGVAKALSFREVNPP